MSLSVAAGSEVVGRAPAEVAFEPLHVVGPIVSPHVPPHRVAWQPWIGRLVSSLWRGHSLERFLALRCEAEDEVWEPFLEREG